jgi:hypothetical protein
VEDALGTTLAKNNSDLWHPINKLLAPQGLVRLFAGNQSRPKVMVSNSPGYQA